MNKLRRSLIKTAIFSPLLLSGCSTLITSNNNQSKFDILKPKRLKKGSVIGIAAPATFVPNPDDVEKAIEVIKYYGFEYTLGSTYNTISSGYKTKEPQIRAKELNEMFSNKNIDGIICIRGGYGSSQILEYLDYGIIKNNPKFFLGYSDITALHLSIYKNTGLITFHGPILLSKFKDYTANYLEKILWSDYREIILKNPPEKDGIRDLYPVRIINDGIAEGRLLGGNLSLITSLIGTNYLPDFKNSILYLEEVGESPYRIDRMLNQMKMAGLLSDLKGVIIGRCNDCNTNSNQTWDLSLGEVIDFYIKPLGIPAMYGLMFGHTDEQFTLPNGCLAEIDTGSKSIKLKENLFVD